MYYIHIFFLCNLEYFLPIVKKKIYKNNQVDVPYFLHNKYTISKILESVDGSVYIKICMNKSLKLIQIFMGAAPPADSKEKKTKRINDYRV